MESRESHTRSKSRARAIALLTLPILTALLSGCGNVMATSSRISKISGVGGTGLSFASSEVDWNCPSDMLNGAADNRNIYQLQPSTPIVGSYQACTGRSNSAEILLRSLNSSAPNGVWVFPVTVNSSGVTVAYRSTSNAPLYQLVTNTTGQGYVYTIPQEYEHMGLIVVPVSRADDIITAGSNASKVFNCLNAQSFAACTATYTAYSFGFFK